MLEQFRVTIEKLDGTKEVILTDPFDDGLPFTDERHFSTFGESVLAYWLIYENGRKMVIHPNSVFRIISERIEVKQLETSPIPNSATGQLSI